MYPLQRIEYLVHGLNGFVLIMVEIRKVACQILIEFLHDEVVTVELQVQFHVVQSKATMAEDCWHGRGLLVLERYGLF